MNPFFIVAIVDDSRKFIDDFPAKLIYNQRLNSERKKNIANEVFKILSFSCIGSAKYYMEKRMLPKPDFFLIDIDFSDLTMEQIDTENRRFNLQLNLESENKRTIGFTFWEYMRNNHPETVSLLLTAKYLDDRGRPEIGRLLLEKKLDLGKDFELKNDKSISFTRRVNDIFKRVAQNIINSEIENYPVFKLDYENVSDKSNSKEHFFQTQINFNRRNSPFNKVSIKTLMFGWGNWSSKGQLEFNDSVVDEFKLLLNGSTSKIKFNGIWKEKFMQLAIQKFKQSNRYRYLDEDINQKTFECLTEFWNCIINEGNINAKAADVFKKYAIDPQNIHLNVWDNYNFRLLFINSLIYRRLLIACSHLQKNYFPNKPIVFRMIQFLGKLQRGASRSSKTQIINIDLGLFGEGFDTDFFLVNCQDSLGRVIMEEETFFLEGDLIKFMALNHIT